MHEQNNYSPDLFADYDDAEMGEASGDDPAKESNPDDSPVYDFDPGTHVKKWTFNFFLLPYIHFDC